MAPHAFQRPVSSSFVFIFVEANLNTKTHLRYSEYARRVAAGYNPTLYVPDTEGWGKLMDRRLAQVERIEDSNARYNAWVSVITSAVVAPNFTESGWGLTRAPEFLIEELRDSLHKGLAAGPPPEHDVDVIEGDNPESRPLFINQHSLNRKTLEVLKPMHEAWSGQKLVGATAYGLRVYRNASSLNMHVDKSGTHIISCILHVDHDDDPESEPWPILIEDFQGNTNEVVLESGDMLFYESSKCIHGRPRDFKGKWYSSIFVHYYPEGWDRNTRSLESHYAIPAHWSEQYPPKEGLEDLVVVGTSLKEPECEDKWCLAKDAVKWNGPAKFGKVISTNHPEGEDFTYKKSDTELYHEETVNSDINEL